MPFPTFGLKDPVVVSLAALCALLLIVLSIPVLERPGVQTDEALFASGVYPPFSDSNIITVRGRQLPLMVMTYVGAFKSWLYRPILSRFGPSVWAVRLPGILLSALSVFAFCILMFSVTNSRAALLSGLLLACDPVYVLYSRWDHGPVVTLHLFLVLALLCLVKFAQSRHLLWLSAGCLLLGLGLWEKAVFIWLLGGMAVSLPIVFGPVSVIRHLKPQALILALVSFSIGAAPLILYNIKNRVSTFRTNTQFDASAVESKIQLLKSTFDGDALFGSMMREPWDGPLKAPAQGVEAGITKVSELSRERRTGPGMYLFVCSIPVLIFAWNRPGGRFAVFALLAGLIAWLQMVFTKGAGGGAHHTILLWPLPYIAAGVALAYAWSRTRGMLSRALLVSVVGVCCIANLLVLSTYYTYLIRNGGTDSWTEAMYPALAYLRNTDKAAIGVVDWGFYDTVRLSEQGRTSIFPVDDPGAAGAEAANLMQQIETPRAVFLSHSEGHETFPGITGRLIAFAGQHGYVPADLRRYYDYNGRFTVQTFRFTKTGEAQKKLPDKRVIARAAG